MNIRVNGRSVQIEGEFTLQMWLEVQRKDKPWTVVEYNGEVLKREQWPKTLLREGDTLEVLVLLGGG